MAAYAQISFIIELLLVLVGAWLYWRAAKNAVAVQGRGGLAANATAALIAVSGILILWMDFTAA